MATNSAIKVSKLIDVVNKLRLSITTAGHSHLRPIDVLHALTALIHRVGELTQLYNPGASLGLRFDNRKSSHFVEFRNHHSLIT